LKKNIYDVEKKIHKDGRRKNRFQNKKTSKKTLELFYSKKATATLNNYSQRFVNNRIKYKNSKKLRFTDCMHVVVVESSGLARNNQFQFFFIII
jgi:hypothetical protein